MPETNVNLSQMIDQAVATTEVGAINANVLNSLLHAMLKRLNVLDGQADLNDLDRDLLSASKARKLSVVSDVDSGRDDDAEDALDEMSSSMPTPSTGVPIDSGSEGITPYQLLKVKVAKMQEQLEDMVSVPSNKHLFEKAKNQHEEKPIGEMWLNMQLFGRVEINEKGIAKCMSMIEDMTNEMQALRDEQNKQMDQIKGLDMEDLMKRLNAMEESMNEVNDKYNTLPSPDEFAKFVTGAGLEDALQGIRNDMDSKLPSPNDSAQFVTEERLEDALRGITPELENLQQSMERILIETSSQTDPGAEMRKKLDEGVLDGLNESSELLEQHQELEEQVNALAAAREQIGESLGPSELLVLPPSERSVPANVELLLQHEKEMQSLALVMTAIQMKVYMLEDRLNLIQGMIKDDFRRWEVKHETDHEEEIRSVFNQNEADRIRNLAYVVNDQLHDIRDDITTLDEDLKKMTLAEELKKKTEELEKKTEELKKKAKAEENALEGTESADFEDMDQDTLIKALKANREEIKKLFAYYEQLQVNKVDKTQGDMKADERTSDQLLQHANSDISTERQKGNMSEADQKAVHFGNVEAFQDGYFYDYGIAEVDVYTTNRSDGGQLTTSHHKRLTKLPHARDTIIIEEEEAKLPHVRNTIIVEEENRNPLRKEEVIVQGTDGNIYKGRMHHFEQKPTSITQATQDPNYIQRRDKSTLPMRYKVIELARPCSAKVAHTLRSSPKNASRPKSAYQTVLHRT